MRVNHTINYVFKMILRWAGSKRDQLRRLSAEVDPNIQYILEGFAGSCRLSGHLNKDSIVIDNNEELINFYINLISDEYICAEAASLDRSEKTYYLIRNQYNKEIDQRNRAVMFYYLNRLCFRGLYRTNVSGNFNVPYNHRPPNFPNNDKVLAFRDFLSRSTVILGDYKTAQKLPLEQTLVYFDPPYQVAGAKYSGEYGRETFKSCDMGEFSEVCESLSNRGVRTLISYIDCEAVRSSFRGWRFQKYEAKSKISHKSRNFKVRDELIIANY